MLSRIALERRFEKANASFSSRELHLHARGFGQPVTRSGVLIRPARGGDEQRRVLSRVFAKRLINSEERTLIVRLIEKALG